MPVQQLYATARRLRREYGEKMSWRKVGAKNGVSPATARRVAGGHDPRSPIIRAALGLPKLALAPLCTCGEFHPQKSCPANRKPKKRRDWRGTVLTLAGLWASGKISVVPK